MRESKLKKLIICYGWFRILDLYTMEIAKAAEKYGREVFLADMCSAGIVDEIEKNIKHGDTEAIMFNNCGLMIEKEGENLWEKYDVPVHDLLTCHPRNFWMLYEKPIRNLRLGVPDREHVKFAERYFPEVQSFFYKQGGTVKIESLEELDNQKKDIDILIIGDNQPENQFPELTELLDGGGDFFVSVIEKMIENPNLITEDIIEDYFKDHDPGFNADKMKEFICEYTYIPEVYVRRTFKVSMLKTLSQENLHVEIYGNDWKIPDYSFSENIHIHERVSPEECLELIKRSKIVLNFMPWFKDGTHSRIYDSQLNGAVCFSDRSRFLEETETDGRTIVFFDYLKRGDMFRRIREILNNDGLRKFISESGYKRAMENSTWEKVFMDYLNHPTSFSQT